MPSLRKLLPQIRRCRALSPQTWNFTQGTGRRRDGVRGVGQRPTNNRPGDQQADRPTTSQPTDGEDDRAGGSETNRDELVEVLRDEVAHLRNQLDRERDASAELRRIGAGLVQRVPELEAALEPRYTPMTGLEDVGGGEVPREPQERSQRRSWLYRFFFGPGT